MTRSPAKASDLKSLGATPAVCDALDPDKLRTVLTQAAPEVVTHQLTDLPARYRQLRKGTPSTDRLRTEGTRNLPVDAGGAVGPPSLRRFPRS